MGTFIVIGLTILVIMIGLAGFFWFAYHTFHGDLPQMFIGALIVLAVMAVLFIVLGLTIPALTVMLL